MSMEQIASLLTPAVQVLLAVGTVLWAVLTKNLSMAINHLTEAVKELKINQHETTKDVLELRERITSIETRCAVLHGIEKNHRHGEN